MSLLALLFAVGLAGAQETSPKGPTMDGIAFNCNAWHTVGEGDTCYSIQQKYSITASQFLKWNTAVSDDCGTNFWAKYSYCVGIDPDMASTSSKSSSTSSEITSTSEELPSVTASVNTTTTPYSTRHPVTSYNLTKPYTATSFPPQRTLSGQPGYCNSWHWIAGGETCKAILNLYGNRITSAQLHEWNPSLGEDCSGLYYGWYVCIGIQARTSISIPWSTSQDENATIPSATEFTPPPFTYVANATAAPQQTGIPTTCQNFYQDENCNSILAEYDYITKEQFFKWNPALKGDCNALWVGYYYCVANFGGGDLPFPPTVTAGASPTASGTVKTCKSWYQAVGNDNCASIATSFGTFSEENFIQWNPAVGSDCADIKGGTFYCVVTPDTPTTRTESLPDTTASMPTQSGVVSECTEFWYVSGDDTCKSIITAARVAASDFYDWNPAVGTNCAGLKPNVYVCVSTSSITKSSRSTVTITGGVTSGSTTVGLTTTKSTTSSPASTASDTEPVSTPSPFMPGMIEGCVRFYFRGPDGADLYCYDLAAAAGISLKQFTTWNPEVGGGCTNLWADTWYCIGVTGPVTSISSGLPSPAATEA